MFWQIISEKRNRCLFTNYLFKWYFPWKDKVEQIILKTLLVSAWLSPIHDILKGSTYKILSLSEKNIFYGDKALCVRPCSQWSLAKGRPLVYQFLSRKGDLLGHSKGCLPFRCFTSKKSMGLKPKSFVKKEAAMDFSPQFWNQLINKLLLSETAQKVRQVCDLLFFLKC